MSSFEAKRSTGASLEKKSPAANELGWKKGFYRALQGLAYELRFNPSQE